MGIHRLFVLLVITFFLAIAPSFLFADVTLPSIIGENMVLQQGEPIPIWGWADPGEKVAVKFQRQKKRTTAASNGHWQVELKPVKAGGPYTMTIAGKNTIELMNILVGEVWICSGQSNMQLSVQVCNNSKQEIAAANYPSIRLFTAQRTVAGQPQQDVPGKWVECSPETVGGFSAAGYFFGRTLHQDLNLPVGLINTSWGGTIAEAWTSRPTLESDPDYQAILNRGTKQLEKFSTALNQFDQEYADWKKKLEKGQSKGTPVPPPPKVPRTPYQNPNRPSVLYNGMIAPLIPYAIQGAIWYQGESNASRAYQYRKLFSDMIQDWRRNWKQGDFTFLFVQLANYEQHYAPNTSWAELREAQNMALSLPNVGVAVTIDIGNPTDIHPRNKQEVGRRLALAAEGIAYGQKLEYSGPMYRSMRVENGQIRVRFDHLGGGLISGDGKDLVGFTIAAADKKFVEAKARIDGDTIVVWNDDITNPVAARYGWADNPENCNLYNKVGLPASPFRTDDWPGLTVNQR